jgi:hypothetical protein
LDERSKEVIMNKPCDQNEGAIWTKICQLEQASTGQLCSLWNEVSHKAERLQAALKNPAERASALRILLFAQNVEQVKAVFPDLVELAAVGHSDIALCRTVIKSIPLGWVRSNIWSAMASSLKSLSGRLEVEEEAYRRYAELLREIDQDLLKMHVEDALRHSNEGVREVGIDFRA